MKTTLHTPEGQYLKATTVAPILTTSRKCSCGCSAFRGVNAVLLEHGNLQAAAICFACGKTAGTLLVHKDAPSGSETRTLIHLVTDSSSARIPSEVMIEVHRATVAGHRLKDCGPLVAPWRYVTVRWPSLECADPITDTEGVSHYARLKAAADSYFARKSRT